MAETPHNESRGVTPSEHFKAVRDSPGYTANVVSLIDRTIVDNDGKEYSRDVVQHPGAVAIVALDEDNNITLVNQYRAPVDGNIWEIPAGKVDVPGEPAVETASRELAEEAGLAAASFKPLSGIYQSAGFSDEFCEIFLATELSSVPQNLDGPEEEAMTVSSFPLAEAVAMVEDRRITDAKTVVGIMAAAKLGE